MVKMTAKVLSSLRCRVKTHHPSAKEDENVSRVVIVAENRTKIVQAPSFRVDIPMGIIAVSLPRSSLQTMGSTVNGQL